MRERHVLIEGIDYTLLRTNDPHELCALVMAMMRWHQRQTVHECIFSDADANGNGLINKHQFNHAVNKILAMVHLAPLQPRDECEVRASMAAAASSCDYDHNAIRESFAEINDWRINVDQDAVTDKHAAADKNAASYPTQPGVEVQGEKADSVLSAVSWPYLGVTALIVLLTNAVTILVMYEIRDTI